MNSYVGKSQCHDLRLISRLSTDRLNFKHWRLVGIVKALDFGIVRLRGSRMSHVPLKTKKDMHELMNLKTGEGLMAKCMVKRKSRWSIDGRGLFSFSMLPRNQKVACEFFRAQA